MWQRAIRRVKFGIRLALLAGFGGVIALMAIAGVDSIRVLHQLEAGHRRNTQSYLEHHHAFERIHALIYGSGTLVRDVLMEPEPRAARNNAAALAKLRSEIEEALAQYSVSVSPEERQLFAELQRELAAYWRAIEPVLEWDGEAKRGSGQAFLRTELLPRRAAILRVADRIDAFNEQTLRTDDRRSAEVFERFRGRTIGVLGLTLTLGFAAAGFSIAYILRLEKEARLRYDETVRARSELQRLSARLVEAQEEERRAISRELHDEVGQSLSALLVDVANLAAVTPCADNPEAGRLLPVIRRLGESSLSAVRNMALLLRPSMLDDLGLVPALHWQAREVSRRTGLHVEVLAEEVADELPDGHKTCIYRIVQEALHNCERHAGAGAARIVVAQKGDRLLLTIEDNGRGFDARNTRGLGLVGMEERVRNLGGVFEIRSVPQGGTVLSVELPLSGAAAHASRATV